MKIVIDMQPLQTPFSASRGVGTYLSGIVNELANAAKAHDLTFMFNAEFPDAYFRCLETFSGTISKQNSLLFRQGILDNYRTASDSQIDLAETFLTAFVESSRPDLVFSANLQEGLDDAAVTTFIARQGRFAQVATLHDVVPLHLGETYLGDPATRRWYHRKIGDAIKCDRIVTVSDRSKIDIQRLLRISESKVEAIPNGYDNRTYSSRSATNEQQRVRAFLGSESEYVLYVGGADQHKNLARLVHAYAALPHGLRGRYVLVLAGGGIPASAEVLKAIAQTDCGERVLLPGYVPQELLPALIRQATTFVFPSTHEGFGLPALEAMACGTPTLGSRGSAVAEVIDLEDATFDPYSVKDIARRLLEVLQNEGLRSKLVEHGLRRAQDFSWRATTERLIEVFEEEHERSKLGDTLRFVSRRLALLGERNVDLLERAATTIGNSVPKPRPSRIYVDASSVAVYGGNSGIQRVVRALCRHLGSAADWDSGTVQVIYAENETNRFRELRSFARNGSYDADPELDPAIDLQAGDKLVFVDLQPSLAIRTEQEMQRWRALGIEVHYVLYDLLPVLMPEKFWPELQKEFFRWLQVISRSDGIICISRTVAEQAVEYLTKFGVRRPDPLRIDYFTLGSDIMSAASGGGLPDNHAELEDAIQGDLNFLMVGTLEPRKGHEQTLQAFEEAWRLGKDWRLVIVGKQGWKMNRLALVLRQHSEFGKRLFWFDNASDDWLGRLYQLADCVICASEGEGFGLPLIEAAKVGKPVIARDIPVFREVAADGAFFFPDTTDPLVLTRSLLAWEEAAGAGQLPDPGAMKPISWQEAANCFAAVLQQGKWKFQAQPRGAVDLRQPVSVPNPNVRVSGMHPPEGDFSWTSARCVVEFDTVEEHEAGLLRLVCFSWTEMPVDISLDGNVVHTADVGHDEERLHIRLPFMPAGKHKIELRMKEAGAPEGDDRILGIGIKELEICAATPVEIGQWIHARDSRAEWINFTPVEFDWRWTLGEKSTIKFDLAEEHDEAQITIFGHAAKPREITFSCNGDRIRTELIDKESKEIILVGAKLKRGANRLDIDVPGVQLFSQKDKRPIGLALLEFRISSDAGKLKRVA